MTEASIRVENKILIEKTCISPISGVPRPSFRSIFHLKMTTFRFFSYPALTTEPIKIIFSIHSHISPRYNIWSSNLTLKVNGGHWRSLEVSGRVTNWAITQKRLIFKENLFGNFYSTLNSLSNGIQYLILFYFNIFRFFSLSPIPTCGTLKNYAIGIFFIWLLIYIKFPLKWYAICKYSMKNKEFKDQWPSHKSD